MKSRTLPRLNKYMWTKQFQFVDSKEGGEEKKLEERLMDHVE